jgi:hypothetical protein
MGMKVWTRFNLYVRFQIQVQIRFIKVVFVD